MPPLHARIPQLSNKPAYVLNGGELEENVRKECRRVLTAVRRSHIP